MAVPDRPVSSIDIMEELGHGGGVVGLTDEDVVALADVTDTVTQLDTEGKSAVSGEVRVTTGPMVNLNVYEFLDRPTTPGNYILIVEHEISSSGAGTPALQSGALPAGSTLTLVVKEYIRGAGGQGGHRGAPDGATGGAAVSTTVPTTIDVTTGYVWGGGGGAGAGSPQGPLQARVSGGGGGAGKASGPGGLGTFGNGSPGTTTTGGKGFVMQLAFGGGGLGVTQVGMVLVVVVPWEVNPVAQRARLSDPTVIL